MFRLIINSKPVDVKENVYFEIVKGTILGKSPAVIDQQYTTEIELPATENNLTVFNSHILFGGESPVLKGVAYFGTKALLVDVQLTGFDNENLFVYLSKRVEWLDVIKNQTVADYYSDLNYYYPSGAIPFAGVNNTIGDNYEGERLPYADTFVDYSNCRGALKAFPFVPKKSIPIRGQAQMALLGGDFPPLAFQLAPSIEVSLENKKDQLVDSCYISITAGLGADYRLRITAGSRSVYDGGVVAVPSGRFAERVDISNINEGEAVVARLDIFNPPYELPAGWSVALTHGGVASEPLEWYSKTTVSGALGNYTTIHQRRISVKFPHVPMLDFLKGVANEAGQYLTIGTHSATGGAALVFKDFASTDGGNCVDLSDKYVAVEGVDIKQPLPAKRNIIQYAEDDNGSYDYIVLNAPNNVIYKELKEEDTYIKLPIYRGGWKNAPEKGAVAVGGGVGLAESLDRWGIYASVFENPKLFKIKFRNLSEVPESAFYVKQLNGLFVASKIIETTNDIQIIEAYKLS